jgi:hypothetical protein
LAKAIDALKSQIIEKEERGKWACRKLEVTSTKYSLYHVFYHLVNGNNDSVP